MRLVTSMLILVVYALPSLVAQSGIGRLYPNNLPGDAVLPRGSSNVSTIVSAATGNSFDDVIGAARLPNGHYIISANRAAGTAGTHKFFELNSDGSFLAVIDQPNKRTPFISGLQDLAWDGRSGPESRIWAGGGKLVFPYDWQVGAFEPVPITGGKALIGFVSSQIQAAAIADIGGQMVLICADWPNPGALFGTGSPVHFYTLNTDNPLTQFQPRTPDFTDPDLPTGQPDFGKFGAAYDSVRGTVWWSLDMRRTNPNPNHSGIRFVEMDLTGALTGKVYQGDRGIGGDANGCEIYQDESGNTVMVYITAKLGIGGLDRLVEVYGGFEFGATCGGQVSYVTEPFIGNTDFQILLNDAPANFTNTAFLFFGRAAVPPGLVIPGINNCGLLLSLDSLRSMGVPDLISGKASIGRSLPDQQSLVGAEVSFQWLLPTAPNFLPLDLSNAGALTIGSNR